MIKHKELQRLDKKRIGLKISSINLKRLFYVPFFIIPISLAHITLFYLKLTDPETVEYKWRIGIIATHSGLIIFSLFIALANHILKKGSNKNTGLIKIHSNLIFLCLLIIGVIVVIVDQWVTPSITPFLVICTILGIVFLRNPRHSIVFFIVGYLLFYFGLGLTQSNPEILLSNRVNGLTSIGIGFFLSLIMWRNSNERIRQALIIERQNDDLTQRYNDLIEQSNQLKSALNTKEKLFSIIGHDLRGPMAGIISLNDLMNQSIEGNDCQKTARFNKAIGDASAQVMTLLDNLLDWSRAQSSRSGLKLDSIEVERLVEHCIRDLSISACNKKVTVNKHLTVKEIHSDINIIKAVIRNLLSNAIKLSFKGGEVDISVDLKGDYIEFSVRDHGVGMDKRTVENLFYGENVISRQGTNDEKGTGLGLVISKDLIEMLGGKLWVESVLGSGSTFYFQVPMLDSK
jgi:signal transduction histidine kinase